MRSYTPWETLKYLGMDIKIYFFTIVLINFKMIFVFI